MNELSAALASALEQLTSDDLESSVGAVEDLAQISNRIIEHVLEEFSKTGPARYLIFERLGRFGSMAIEPLEQLLKRTGDRELRVLAAGALLSLGSEVGVKELLDAVKVDDPLICVAVRVLADASIAQASSRIEDAIIKCDLERTAIIECLVVALRSFADPLPDNVRARLQGVEPDWLRESLLN